MPVLLWNLHSSGGRHTINKGSNMSHGGHHRDKAVQGIWQPSEGLGELLKQMGQPRKADNGAMS